jgi:hypothetical protein
MTLHPIAHAAAVAACCLAGVGAPAGATSLGLTALASPDIAASVAASIDPALFFLFSTEGTGAPTPTGGGAPTPVEFLLSADISADALTFNGDFSVLGLSHEPVLSSATLTGVGFIDNRTTDVIEFLFTSIGGAATAEFGTEVLVRLFGDFGTDPFADGFGTFLTPMTALLIITTVGVPPAVPLPAAGLLLLAGLGALAGLRRRA